MRPSDIKKARYIAGRILNKNKLSQNQFANLLGLSDGRRIREWEVGDKQPNGSAQIIIEYILTKDKNDNLHENDFLNYIAKNIE